MCFGKVRECEDSINRNASSITACEYLIDSLISENNALKRTVSVLKEEKGYSRRAVFKNQLS